jgi:hypothetical protein
MDKNQKKLLTALKKFVKQMDSTDKAFKKALKELKNDG